MDISIMSQLFFNIKNPIVLFELIKADFKNRYLANYFGVVWALIQSLVTVATYWFVFTKGFKVSDPKGATYLLWMLAGMIPWFLFNEAITTASTSIYSQSFLVKKIIFDVKLLPLIKIGSSVMVNVTFWLLFLIFCLCNHFYPTLLWLQLFYYLICIICICTAGGLFLSSCMPFFPDIRLALPIFLQVVFWITPITWNANMLSGNWTLVATINPLFYIINGIRCTLIDHTSLWYHPMQMAYFWGITITMYLLANKIFNQLRPHFADIL